VEGGFVFRRTLALIGTLVVAATCLASTALAARVKVRVEGFTTTIFGAAEPHLSASNGLAALDAASRSGEFYYHVTETSFGPYVDQIGRYAAFGSSGWAYKVNGVSPPVGADKLVLKKGDTVLWYWAFFGLQGGPQTLLLQHASRNCYRVYKQDDNGKKTAALGAVLHAGQRKVKTQGSTQAAVGCIEHRYGVLVRATLRGSVRSNALS
jgi:hypothetical protein